MGPGDVLHELYVPIDDWYKQHWEARLARRVGAKPSMSDSEVLTVLVAGQWQVGVAWRSERGLLRWLAAYGRGWFPKRLKRSAFNARARNLWGGVYCAATSAGRMVRQHWASYQCVDGVSVPVYSCGQACRQDAQWLWESKRGHGGTRGGWSSATDCWQV